ncbi:hypothetical protein M569_09167, partial [Genlisea aurea]
CVLLAAVLLSSIVSESATEPYRRDPGHPAWHHGAFQDVKDTVRSDVHQMLHARAEVPFQVPLEVNVILVGFEGDGGYRYEIDSRKLVELLDVAFRTHRPSCLETGQPLDVEHHLVFNVLPSGQAPLIGLEHAIKTAMVPAGMTREADFGREVPLFEVEATAVEPEFEKLYSYLFDSDHDAVKEMDTPQPTAIFVVNTDKASNVRLDPRNKEIDLGSLMYAKIPPLSEDDLKNQDGGYIYRYRYNGGGASQVWLGSGRFVVIDLSAGPCTYGKIETEEGSVNPKTLPRLQNVLFPGSVATIRRPPHDVFLGHLAAVIATVVEHVIAPDVRFEIVDMSTRLLVPIIVLQNHNRYNIMEKGHNYSIDVEAIEDEIRKMIHHGQEVVIVGGTHPLHRHEKLSIAVSKAMRAHSLQETKNDGRFHVHTKMYLDGAILKEEMERSADVLAAGLLEVSDPNLTNRFFFRTNWTDGITGDSVLKHQSHWESRESRHKKDKKKRKSMKGKKDGGFFRLYGTRVVPVFVLSLADVDQNLMMEDDSLLWTGKDVVIVLQHQSEKIPLSYVSEIERRHAIPSQAQRHILAGLASVVGGLSAPYEKASHVHERPVVNWLMAAGCHPFGPFSNTSRLSQTLRDVALRNQIYARVDAALHQIRATSQAVQAFVAEHLKTPVGEPVKGKKNKTTTELWLEKFIKKKTNLPEPFPHEFVQGLEADLDSREEQLVELSSLLYDHRLLDADAKSSEIHQTAIFTHQYAEHVLTSAKEQMKCCSVGYGFPARSSSQSLVYAGILAAGFIVYFGVIFFFASPPVR